MRYTSRMRRILSVLVLLAASAASSHAQTPIAPALQSHQVNSDGTITFRYQNKAAKEVIVSLDAPVGKLPMTMNQEGLWSVTTAKLAPEFYGYAFLVDGVTTLDPLNPLARRNFAFLGSNVMLPADTPKPWELTSIPHGRVDRHVFTTHIGKNLPANQSAYVVYTPPGYDSRHKGGYPVLYLLHGWSDDETGWDEVGRANYILDDMLAKGSIVPMVVVMPLGYGNLDFVTHGFDIWGNAAKIDENTELYSGLLLTEVVPAVEKEYSIAAGRNNHAIIGLSMGGLESLYIGLNHTSQFAYVGGMSAAIHQRKFDQHIAGLDAKKADLKLLWVACGTEDNLIEPNREFVKWAKGKGFAVTAVETPGAHVWPVWRENLLQFAPLLFRSK